MPKHNTLSDRLSWAGGVLMAGLLAACQHTDIEDGGPLTALSDQPVIMQAAEPSQSGQFLAARQALYNLDVGAAGAFFDRTLANEDNNIMLLEQSFLSHYQSGNLDKAAGIAAQLEAAGSALHLSAEPAVALAVRAEDWQAVLALSEKMALTDNGFILATGLRSLAYVGLNEPETAFHEQQKLVDFIKNSQTAVPPELLSLHRAYLAELTGQPEDAVFHYRAAGRAEPVSDYMMLAVASGLWRLGLTDEALATLRLNQDSTINEDRLASLFRSGKTELTRPTSLQQIIARLIFEFSWFARLQGNQTLVLPRLHLALSIWPGLELAHLILAQTFIDTAEYPQAAFHLQQIGPLSPYYIQAASLKMQRAYETNGAEAAFAEMDTALQALSAVTSDDLLNKDRAVLLRYAGSVARQSGLYETAVRYFEAALRTGAQTNFIYRNLGISYERLDQTQKAEQAFLKALDLNPDDAVTLNYIGYWWADENRRLDEALVFVRRAVELQPASGYFADSLGWVYFRMGRYEEAVDWLEKAIQLAPTDPLISDHLGDAYWKVGRRLEARYKWQHALDMGIEPPLPDQIYKKMTNGLD